MTRITLRKIPDDVDASLRKLAKKRSKSLNSTTIDLLKKGLGLEEKSVKHRNLDKYAGTWSDNECKAFEKELDIFEKIDSEIWK